MTDSRLEETKIVMFSEASTWKSIPQLTQLKVSEIQKI